MLKCTNPYSPILPNISPFLFLHRYMVFTHQYTYSYTYSSGAEAGHMYLFNCLSFQLPTFRLQSIFILCLTVVCFSFSWSMWLLLFIYFVLLYWTFKPSAMRTTYRQTGGWADGRTDELMPFKTALIQNAFSHSMCAVESTKRTHAWHTNSLRLY